MFHVLVGYIYQIEFTDLGIAFILQEMQINRVSELQWCTGKEKGVLWKRL